MMMDNRVRHLAQAGNPPAAELFELCDSLALSCISLPLNEMSQVVTKAEGNGSGRAGQDRALEKEIYEYFPGCLFAFQIRTDAHF